MFFVIRQAGMGVCHVVCSVLPRWIILNWPCFRFNSSKHPVYSLLKTVARSWMVNNLSWTSYWPFSPTFTVVLWRPGIGPDTNTEDGTVYVAMATWLSANCYANSSLPHSMKTDPVLAVSVSDANSYFGIVFTAKQTYRALWLRFSVQYM